MHCRVTFESGLLPVTSVRPMERSNLARRVIAALYITTNKAVHGACTMSSG